MTSGGRRVPRPIVPSEERPSAGGVQTFFKKNQRLPSRTSQLWSVSLETFNEVFRYVKEQQNNTLKGGSKYFRLPCKKRDATLTLVCLFKNRLN